MENSFLPSSLIEATTGGGVKSVPRRHILSDRAPMLTSMCGPDDLNRPRGALDDDRRATVERAGAACNATICRTRCRHYTLSLDQARRLDRTAAASALLGSDPQAHRQELLCIATLIELARDRYLPHAKANKRSWHIDEMNLRHHLLPALGRLTLDEITNEHVAKLISDMRGDGYAAGTMRIPRQSGRGFRFDVGHRSDLIPATIPK
jgi:hypothetical protein